MSPPEEHIAHRLAAHFASELDPALPQQLILLFDEGQGRAADPSVLLGYASYVVGLTTLALSLYRQRTEGEELAALRRDTEALSARLKEALIKEAPPHPTISAPLRERMASKAVEVVLHEALHGWEPPTIHRGLGPGPLLDHREIVVIHKAVIAARLRDRDALLSGVLASFKASLPVSPAPSSQVLCDLDALNAAGTLADGSVPLSLWLVNAATLAGDRPEGTVFEVMNTRLARRE